MKRVLFLLTFLVTGCASNNLPIHQYDKSDAPVYPQISVIVNDGYVRSNTSCYQYGCYDYVDHITAFTMEELRDSKLFQNVVMNNALERYKVYVKVQRQTRGSKAAELAKIMFSSASLLTIPITYKYTYNAEFVVYDNSEVRETFIYSLDSDETVTLIKDPEDEKRKAVKSIVSHFLMDLQKTNTFDVESYSQL